MHAEIRQKLEDVFRNSNSPDELFDSFRIAISGRIKDEELYKILLRNKALSTDEISMFAEKICKEFPGLRYNIYFCVGQLFGSISTYGKHLDKALAYMLKSAAAEPTLSEPYTAIAKMYNKELNIPALETIIKTIEDGISLVEIKSPLCFALVDLYKLSGDKDKELGYQKLGEIFQREGK